MLLEASTFLWNISILLFSTKMYLLLIIFFTIKLYAHIDIFKIKKRALHFFSNDYGSAFEGLLRKSGCTNMNLKRQGTLHRNI